jgi:hypothetical protein
LEELEVVEEPVDELVAETVAEPTAATATQPLPMTEPAEMDLP